MTLMDSHEVAREATEAVDADSSELIYGKFELGRIYSALPPAPDGYELRPASKADGTAGWRYVEAGAPRETRAGAWNGRGVYVRLFENTSKARKGVPAQTTARMVFDAPAMPGTETVVFNRNSVPFLLNSLQLGPRPATATGGRSPYISGDNLLIACAVAARKQAVEVSKLAADKNGGSYNGTAFFKEGVDLESVLESPGLIDQALAYASPGGAGWDSRVSYYANDNSDFASQAGKRQMNLIEAWLNGEAARQGYNTEVVLNQIKAHCDMLEQNGMPVPEELEQLI